MRTAIVLLGLLLAIFAGCFEGPAETTEKDERERLQPGDVVGVPCGWCVEPMPAWQDDAQVLVIDATGATALVGPDATAQKTTSPTTVLPKDHTVVEAAIAHGDGTTWAAVTARPTALDRQAEGVVHLAASTNHGQGWTTRHVFEVGQGIGVTPSIADRPFVEVRGPYVVVSWNVANPTVTEYAASVDGGNTFGPTGALPLHPQNVVQSRIAISQDGTLVAGQALTSGLGTADLGEPGVGLLDALRSTDHGNTWTTHRVPIDDPRDGPHRYMFLTGVAWSEPLGFVLGWSDHDGTMHVSTSATGTTWSAATTLWQAGPRWMQPWVEAHNETVTWGFHTRPPATAEDTTATFHFGIWHRTDGPGRLHELGTHPQPREFTAHRISPTGLAAVPVPTFDGMQLHVLDVASSRPLATTARGPTLN